MQFMRELLYTKAKLPLVIYGHCEVSHCTQKTLRGRTLSIVVILSLYKLELYCPSAKAIVNKIT